MNTYKCAITLLFLLKLHEIGASSVDAVSHMHNCISDHIQLKKKNIISVNKYIDQDYEYIIHNVILNLKKETEIVTKYLHLMCPKKVNKLKYRSLRVLL